MLRSDQNAEFNIRLYQDKAYSDRRILSRLIRLRLRGKRIMKLGRV